MGWKEMLSNERMGRTNNVWKMKEMGSSGKRGEGKGIKWT